MRTVVGLYNHIEDAQGAVKMLRDAGFNKEDINLVARDANGEFTRYFDDAGQSKSQDLGDRSAVSDGAAAGVGVGAVLGGLGGLLLGLGALAIPGIGPVVAAGPIATTLIGAGAGAVTGGIVGALVDMGIPKEHAEAYAEGIRRGGTLVTVRTQDDRSDDAVQILEHFNPVDINQEMQAWRSASWQGFDDTAEPFEWNEVETSQQRENIPVTGHDQVMEESVVEEDVSVGQPENDFEGISGRDFRSHFDRTFAAQGMDYNDVMPAYRYGHSLATDRRFQNYDWDSIEPEARMAWEHRYGPNTWDRIRDAVYYAWDQARL